MNQITQFDESQQKPPSDEEGIIVCMPTRGQICYETHLALCENLRDVHICNISVGRRPVAEARNILAQHALKVAKENPFPFVPREVFVLWVDDDAWWPAGMVSDMLLIMRREPTLDALFAKFGYRNAFSEPVALRKRHETASFPKEGVDCGHTDVVDIERAGMHFCLMRLSILERLGDSPFSVPEGSNTSEDFAFCDKARAAGARLAVAMQMPALHIDADTGLAYLPGHPAMLMTGNEARGIDPQLADSLQRAAAKRRVYGDGLDDLFHDSEQKATAKMQSEVEKRIDVIRAGEA